MNELTTKETIKFITTFDDDNQATFEALALLKDDQDYKVDDQDYKAFESVHIPTREKIDVPVTINWLELTLENTPQEVTVSLINPITGEVITQTGTDAVTFSNVSKYTAYEDEVQYELSQEPIDGYITTVKGFTITNIKEPDPTQAIFRSDGTRSSGETIKPTSDLTADTLESKAIGETSGATRPNAAGTDSDTTEKTGKPIVPTDPTNEEGLVQETLTPEEAILEETNVEEIATEEEKHSATEDSFGIELDELLTPDPLADGSIIGLEVLPDPIAPMAVGSEETAGGSGDLYNRYGTYSWGAIASADGMYVDWTLQVTKTGTLTRYPLIEFTVPSEFNALTSANITATSTTSYRPSITMRNGGRQFTVHYSSISAAVSTTTVTFRTYVANCPNTTTQNFTLSFVPAVGTYASGTWTYYGPSNSARTTNYNLAPAGLNWVVPVPTVANPGYSPNTNVTINKVDQNNAPLPDAVFTLSSGVRLRTPLRPVA